MAKMAEKIALVEDFLTCSICLEMFKEPVSLSCHHNFCSSCLQKYWDQSKTRNCHNCKRRSSKGLDVNFALKKLADSFAGRKEPGSSEKLKAESEEVVQCKHGEDQRVFCKDKARALSPVREFSLHQQHTVVPVETAVSELKEQLLAQYRHVLLDPKTAHKCLSLSEDLCSVRHGDTYQQVPDNPERFTKYPIVLGSEGFSSGTHIWDVEVGDHPNWNIGVAKKSIDRKGERSVSSEYGLWCLYQQNGKYSNCCGETISVKRRPEKIRFKLNYDMGQVSFYDADDMTHLFTHKHTFTEKLFPYFSVGPAAEAKTKDIKICPRVSSVSLLSESPRCVS